MKFTIDRSMWGRGSPANAKLVRAEDGKMCCLGFFLLACGVPREKVLELGEPQEPFEKDPDLAIPEPAAFLVDATPPDDGYDDDDGYWDGGEAEFACSAAGGDYIEINDDPDLAESERERRLSLLFGGQGVEVEFVDGTGPSGRPAP